MTIEEKAKIIRLGVTATIIANYAMLMLKDETKYELRKRVNDVIKSCQRVEQYFVTHECSKEETRQLFRQQFNSNEICMLSELLRTCMVLDEHGIEAVISSVNDALAHESREVEHTETKN
jgi:hypothetical protein